MIVARVLATILLGGVAALDATPIAQTLFFQPLVTSAVLGWIWQDMPLALTVGAILQILAASTLPIGARTPEDYATGGVIGTGVALVLATQQPYSVARDGAALLGTFAGMLGATAGVPFIKWQRRRNEGLARWCEDELKLGNEGALAAAHGAGVVLSFGTGVLWTAAGLGVGTLALLALLRAESLWLARAWTFAQPLWIGLGLAQLLNAFVQRRLMRVAAFGAALFVTWMLLVFGAP